MPLPTERLPKSSSLVEMEGDLATNLMKFKIDDPEVDTYLATDEGKAEIQKWLDWMPTAPPRKF
jgi:hypothetical protein